MRDDGGCGFGCLRPNVCVCVCVCVCVWYVRKQHFDKALVTLMTSCLCPCCESGCVRDGYCISENTLSFFAVSW